MGVSETYFTRDTTATGAAALIQDWLAKRTAMQWSNQGVVGVRVAVEGDKRKAALLVPPGDLFPGTNTIMQIPSAGSIPFLNGASNPDLLRVVLQLRLNFDTTRTTLRYLSGIPDANTHTDPATFETGAYVPWYKAYSSWWKSMVDNAWAVKGIDKSSNNPLTPIIGLSKQAAPPSFMGIHLAGQPAPAIARGDKVSCRGFRPAKGVKAATINGTWYVDSVDTTTFPDEFVVYLRGSQLIDPALQRFTDASTLQRIRYSLYPIQSVTWVRAGIHKRGRPSIAPRGRRLTHVSLDP
jgi:hypothetical protein